jgi:4-diphosphocytidyl-2-C-methyl-D-erythritol kinase
VVLRIPRSTSFAPAKINLGLRITGRYANGYHRLESIFAVIPIYDRIEIAESSSADTVRHIWPRSTTIDETRNLAAGTLRNPLLAKTIEFCRSILSQHFGVHLPAIALRLTKSIPSPAGLGGASSDAAAVVRALLFAAVKFRICSETEIMTLITSTAFSAAVERLGADIPYFLSYGHENRAARLCGVGHELTPVKVPTLHGFVCVPEFGFSTGLMFARVRQLTLPTVPTEPGTEGTGAAIRANSPGSESILALRLNEIPYSDDVVCGIKVVQNDFEAVAETVFPAEFEKLKRAKVTIATTLKQYVHASGIIGMTGSGAGLFGLAAVDVKPEQLNLAAQVLQARLGTNWKVFRVRCG